MKNLKLIIICLFTTILHAQPNPKVEYITNIDLSNDTQWQLILGSQDAGTNYGIYVKLKNGKSSNPEMKFKIVNYKGSTKFGIEDVIFRKSRKKIYISVQALNSNFETKFLPYGKSLTQEGMIITQKIVVPMFEIPNDIMNQQMYEKLKSNIVNLEEKLKNPEMKGSERSVLFNELSLEKDKISNIFIKDYEVIFNNETNKGLISNNNMPKYRFFQAEFSGSKLYNELSDLQNDLNDSLTEFQFKLLDEVLFKLNSIVDEKFFYIDNTFVRPRNDFELEPDKLAGLRCMQGNNKIKN